MNTYIICNDYIQWAWMFNMHLITTACQKSVIIKFH